MLNLHHLQILRTVAASESYSRAADRLGISQPAVSMQIKKLEEALGVTLITSKGRLIALTDAGQALLGYADRLLRLNDEAEATMADFRALRRGRLRIAASSTPGAYLLPGAIAGFRALHADVTVTLEVGNTRTALRRVEEGLADLAVVGEAEPDGLDVTLLYLCEDLLEVVVAPGHPWALAGAVEPAELARAPLVLREEGSSTRAVLDRRLMAAVGRKAQPGMELGSTEAVKEAVAAGLGATVLSGLAVKWELASGRLVRVAAPGLDLSRALHVAMPVSEEPSPLAGAFVACLRT